MKTLINSFNAGEVTPLVWGRVDLESMRRACRELKNFIPRVFGGAFRRPSLMHVAMVNDATRHARLIPFSFSAQKKFQIEVGHLVLRIFNADTGAVVFGPIAAPWTETQVDAVQFVQVNDVMWLVHPDVQEVELVRIADNNWTFNNVPWTTGTAFPPMRDENISATKLWASATMGNGVLLNSTTDIFQVGHLGSYWKIAHYRNILSSELAFDPDPKRVGNTIDLQITETQNWVVETSGRWSGTLIVEKYNTDDKAYDIEEQRENSTGNQVFLSGAGSGTATPGKFRLRARDITVAPGSNVVLTFGVRASPTSWTQVASITFTPPAYLAPTSTEIRVNGRWELVTYGRWAGEMYLEEKNAAGAWDVIRRWTGEMDRNISATGTVEGESTLRLRAANVYAAPASDVARPRWVLEATDSLVHGLVQVTGYLGPRQVTANVLKVLYSTEQTTHWSEGAFSTARGFPRAVALHEQRLVFAGTRNQPQHVWGSVSADFRNFSQTGLDDGSFVYQIAAQESNPIAWLASQDGLIVGTEGDEWLMTGGTDKPITPSNIRVKRQSGEGSSPIQAQLAGSTVLFIDQSGFHVREYVFEWETQNYVAPYVTQLANHLTLAGIRAFAIAKTPDKTIWVVTNDGKLLSCAYRREEQVIAWAQHETNGTVESVAAVYGLPAGGTEVWLVVDRFGTRRIERLKSGYWPSLESGQQVWHLDAAVEKTGSFAVLDGLDHLEGQEVGIVADGAELSNALVIDGEVAVPPGTTHAVAGLNFTSRLWPMPLEVPLQDGTAQGRRFRVTELALLLYKTQAGTYADGPGKQAYPIIIRQATDDPNTAPPAFSGLKRLQTMSDFRDGVDVIIETNSAMPLNVLSLVPTLGVYGS
jgi:hypothetical protein